MKQESKITSQRYRQILLDEFAQKKAKNPAYSMRAFAKYLEVDHSNLNKILKGEKYIGMKYIVKLAKKLHLTNEDLEQIQNSEKGFENLTLDTFKIISHWYYDAILELTKVDEFKSDIDWISRKLQIPRQITKEAIDRLVKLELLDISDKGRWKDNLANNSFITNSITSSAQQNYQKEILELAKEAIDRFPRSERSQSSLTMAICKDKLKVAEQEIKLFRRKMSEILEDGGDVKNDVYQLSISLFPLTEKN